MKDFNTKSSILQIKNKNYTLDYAEQCCNFFKCLLILQTDISLYAYGIFTLDFKHPTATRCWVTSYLATL